MIPIDLTDKRALITGASGGLGRAMARTLAQAGADIIVHYHQNQTQADTLVTEIQSLGRAADAVQADITDQPAVDAMRDHVAAEIGPPDILVTNAVIQYDWHTILEQSLDDYESQFRSCVMQNVLIAQAFLPAMIENQWGRVIGINSECAMSAAPTTSAYVAGKRGMDGILRVLAKEVGPHGITVNQVAPGWTIIDDNADGDHSQAYRDQLPLRRRGTDLEIAHAVAFLASDLAAFITGLYLPVAGGNVMPAI